MSQCRFPKYYRYKQKESLVCLKGTYVETYTVGGCYIERKFFRFLCLYTVETRKMGFGENGDGGINGKELKHFYFGKT